MKRSRTKHPKNVQAVLQWYATHKPGDSRTVERLFAEPSVAPTVSDPPPLPSSRIVDLCVALLLQGFEAGREFEREHPDVESGIGYLSD